MNAQTQIKGDRLTTSDPNEIQCEWCDKHAADSLPLMCRVKGRRGGRVQSGMRVYFCRQHREQAKRLIEKPIR